MANPGDPPTIQDMGPSERMRVTRELHDIEQSLAILGVQMMRAGKAVSGLPGALHPGIPELSGKLKEVGERVGRLSRELHSSRLKSFNLADAIQKYVEDSSKQFHIPVASAARAFPLTSTVFSLSVFFASSRKLLTMPANTAAQNRFALKCRDCALKFSFRLSTTGSALMSKKHP